MSIDFERLTEDLLAALRGSVADNVEESFNFARSQARQVAAFAKTIVEQRTDGILTHDDDLFDHFIRSLELHARDLAFSVVQMALITMEQAWNAIVDTVWGAINQSLGALGLPTAALPARQSPVMRS